MNTTSLAASELGAWTVAPVSEYASWGNSTDSAFWDRLYVMKALFSLTVLVSLVGLVGNGAVIWLLGFRVKRNSFSVYILNLACADFIFLFSDLLGHIFMLTPSTPQSVDHLAYSVNRSSFLVSLCLLMAVSTERCVSVLCPIWHRCHRPAHLSSVLCALTWALGSCIGSAYVLCSVQGHDQEALDLVFCVTSVLTCLVLCVSSLKLLLQVQCFSRRRRPGRLYLSLLLSVLAFLLLGLPYGVQLIVYNAGLGDSIYLQATLNSAVNPIIYFFVGRCRQSQGRKPLWEVLQSALTPEEGISRGGDSDRRQHSLPLGPDTSPQQCVSR